MEEVKVADSVKALPTDSSYTIKDILVHASNEIDAQDSLLQKVEQFFDKFITLQLITRHTVFNEDEAAFYCRIPVSSLRYHALRSKKLTFLEITKEGLVFLKTDLDKFLSNSRIKSYRDHS